MKKYENVLDLIGWTPLVPVRQLNTNKKVEILAKLESFNPGGSIKDRPALYMIQEAEKRGELNKDKVITEATSGNTGIGLSLVAAVKGYRILLGGKLGRHPQLGWEWPGIHSEEDLLAVLNRVLDHYRKYNEKGERLGEVLKRHPLG